MLQNCKMSDLDTPRHHRKRHELKKQKRPARQRCKWTLWVPVSVLVLLAVCVYLKDHPSDVAYWSHISAVKTSDQNLTYYYKVRPGQSTIGLELTRTALSTSRVTCAAALHVLASTSIWHSCTKALFYSAFFLYQTCFSMFEPACDGTVQLDRLRCCAHPQLHVTC